MLSGLLLVACGSNVDQGVVTRGLITNKDSLNRTPEGQTEEDQQRQPKQELKQPITPDKDNEPRPPFDGLAKRDETLQRSTNTPPRPLVNLQGRTPNSGETVGSAITNRDQQLNLYVAAIAQHDATAHSVANQISLENGSQIEFSIPTSVNARDNTPKLFNDWLTVSYSGIDPAQRKTINPTGTVSSITTNNLIWKGQQYGHGDGTGIIYSNLPKSLPNWVEFFGASGSYRSLAPSLSLVNQNPGRVLFDSGELSQSLPKSIFDWGVVTKLFENDSGMVEFNNPDGTNIGDKPKNRMDYGKLFGVSGYFSCVGQACRLTKVSDTTLQVSSELGEDLYFTPDLSFGRNILDFRPFAIPQHIYFGYWMSGVSGAHNRLVKLDTFAMAVGYGEVGDLEEVHGKASYTGAAAGIFSLTAGGHGEFVANIKLDANFQDSGSISGIVNSFKSVGGTRDLSAWQLTLETTDLSTRPNGLFNGTTGGESAGSWSGQLHGGGVPEARSRGRIGRVFSPPSAVTGEFNGTFSDGSVAGAFGAEKN